MDDERPKYWLHRITGGKNAAQLSHPLLFNHKNLHILSTGWCDFSSKDNLKKIQDGGEVAINDLIDSKWKKGYRPRSRRCLNRFINDMHAGDIVVVPTWGQFHIYRIADEQIMTIESIPDEWLIDEKGRKFIKDNGKLKDAEGNNIDLGFFRRVELVEGNLSRRDYATKKLCSRLKVFQTNVSLKGLESDIEEARSRKKQNMPVNIYTELQSATLGTAKKVISKYVQNKQYEFLVEKYLRALGAEIEDTSYDRTPTEGGDADRVAIFEDLKLKIRVQVKNHGTNTQTGKGAVEQIILYAENHPEEEYFTQCWVISNAQEFSEDAKKIARKEDVRLINGDEFAKMILDVGLKHFE